MVAVTSNKIFSLDKTKNEIRSYIGLYKNEKCVNK
jgi:hypothetical protein